MGAFEIHLTVTGSAEEVENFASVTGGSLLRLDFDGAGGTTNLSWDRNGTFAQASAFATTTRAVAMRRETGTWRRVARTISERR